jgi:hypothetical protein
MSAPDAASRDSPAIDTASKKFAFVFRVPVAGDIGRVFLKVGSSGALNAASAVRISLQNVSAADGFPDGVQDQTVDTTGASVTANAVIGGLLSAARTVAAGDLLAVVVEYETFTAADTFNIAEVSTRGGTASADLMNRAFPYALFDAGAGFLRDQENTPFIDVGYGVGGLSVVQFIAPDTPPTGSSAPSLVTFDSSTTPDEVGIELRLRFRARIAGCWFFGRIETNVNLVLYDPTPTALQTMLLDKDVRGYTGGPANHFIRFPGSFDIEANSLYRLTLRPVDAAALISLGHTALGPQIDADAAGGFLQTKRTDLGGFISGGDVAPIPQMGVFLTGFEDGLPAGVVGVGRAFMRGMVR